MRFFWWHQRLETRPEAILAVLRVLHKNLSCSFDLFSPGSEIGAWSVWRSAFCQWGETSFFSLSSFFFFLSLCSISGRYASATSRKGFPSILPWKQGTHSFYSSSSSRLGSPSTNQMPLKEIWLRLCVTFELSRIGQDAGSEPTLLLMGELESRGWIDLPVTFTRLA